MVDPFTPNRRLLYADYTVLCSTPDGTIAQDPEGLYDHDTRIVSQRRLTVDGDAPELVSSSDVGDGRGTTILLARRPGPSPDGPSLPQDALEIRIETSVGTGLTERITLVNRSMTVAEPEVRLNIETDFADIQEVRRDRRQQGDTTSSAVEAGLEILYAAEHADRTLERGVRVVGDGAKPSVDGAGGTLAWRPRLEPQQRWTTEVRYESFVDGRWLGVTARDAEARAWRERRPAVESEPALVRDVVTRAMEDLFALRNRLLDGDGAASWIPNAGVPMYTGFFGRDALTAAWQSFMLGPEIARGTLDFAAARQATTDDPFRDAEPGKLLHEARRGPLSELDILPQRAYFGTQTSPALFVIALSELWHWTGDDEALRTHLEPARRALAWAAEHGDLDGDGFLESRTRSPEGLRNQGWKDSNEAIRYPDGRNVDPPLATVEEQAFHVLALERMAEILVALDEDDEAEVILGRANDLRRRSHDAFWLPDDGFYAMALDRDKVAVASVGSNAGHALGAGLVPPRFARQVAERLLKPDLFSGWGVRTLSSEHQSYNPFAYHLGTVWPVEQSTIALGMKRYGLDDHAARVIDGMLAAAAAFRDYRLPELLSGLSREEHVEPVPYPDANAPQAWSASATIQLLQVSLGLYPFAALGLLALVRPRLPAGVDAVTIRRLRVGDATVSIRFERGDGDTVKHDVLEREGRLVVLEAPPPQDVHGTTAVDAIKAWAIEHAPGRHGRALRIALGLEGPEG
jgi:glycogen debranching enzyme